MSTSEKTASLSEVMSHIEHDVNLLVERVTDPDVSRDELPTLNNRLIAAVLKVHAIQVEYDPEFKVDPSLASPSAALTLVSSLLEAHDINSFDLAMWLSRTGQS